jgi:hypothetical protein
MRGVKFIKKDMKSAYKEFTTEHWKKADPLSEVWQTAWEMALDSVNCKKYFGYYEPAYPINKDYNIDPHMGCYSYPNCDIDPNGCCVENGDDAIPYGHRD